MLKVHVPVQYPAERTYITDVLLKEFLGLDYELHQFEALRETVITDDQRSLKVADVFFQTPIDQWLQPTSLPKLPLDTWTPSINRELANLPVLFGRTLENNTYFLINGENASLGLDVFGGAFFMLSRYEEMVKQERDSHERFSASRSLAHQANFLIRPVVNEYLEVLWAAMTHCFPQIQRKPRIFRIFVSHDVDQPFGGAGRVITRVARSMAGDIKKGRPIPVALQRAQAWLKNDFEDDPCNTFDYLMSESEKRGLVSAFYFICGHSGGAVDGDYQLEQPRIQSLMRQIHAHGHEIGLHPSYNTFRNSKQLNDEFERLRAACAQSGIRQLIWGGRQHYVRWENPITWQLWEDTGLTYDSTLTFPDSVGFRCGVCYEYPVFNLGTRQTLALRERPLVVMEVSLWDYMGIQETDIDGALNHIVPILDACKKYNGDFTLLWHNHNFRFVAQKQVYEQILDTAANG